MKKFVKAIVLCMMLSTAAAGAAFAVPRGQGPAPAGPGREQRMPEPPRGDFYDRRGPAREGPRQPEPPRGDFYSRRGPVREGPRRPEPPCEAPHRCGHSSAVVLGAILAAGAAAVPAASD
jgi:hypothetical protein